MTVSSQRTQPLSLDEVLHATSELLAANGAAGFRLKQLANKLGVTVPSIYRFFPTKEELIRTASVAAHDKLIADYAARIDALPAATSGAELLETLHHFVAEFSPELRYRNQITRIRSLVSALHEPPLLAHYRHVVQRLDDAIESYMRRNQESGVLRSDFSPQAIALVVHALVGSSSLMTAEPLDAEQLAEYWTAVVAAIGTFLTTPPTR